MRSFSARPQPLSSKMLGDEDNVHFGWTEALPIQNLPELKANLQYHGGRVVQFRRMWSAVAYSENKTVYEWVAPGKSRSIVGLWHALFSLVFGWWSFMGAIFNLSIVLNNLAGGIDMTAAFQEQQPFQTAGTLTPEQQMRKDLKREERVQAVTAVISLIAYIALAAIFALTVA